MFGRFLIRVDDFGVPKAIQSIQNDLGRRELVITFFDGIQIPIDSSCVPNLGKDDDAWYRDIEQYALKHLCNPQLSMSVV